MVSVVSRNIRDWLPSAARRWHVPGVAHVIDTAAIGKLVHTLADAMREAWVWVRQPADDPLVRARSAFGRVMAHGEIPGFQWLEADLRVAITNRHAMTEALCAVGEDEEALIYVLIAYLAFERLRSGEHHVARGRLGPKGRQIHAAYKEAAARLIQFGVLDRATYEQHRALLRHEIERTG